MFYTVIKDGEFTGAQYPSLTPNVMAHHAVMDETFILLDRSLCGDDLGAVVAPDELAAGLINMLRFERNSRLSVVDRYQGALSFADLSADQQLELAAYRLQLLDAPQVGVLPVSPVWIK